MINNSGGSNGALQAFKVASGNEDKTPQRIVRDFLDAHFAAMLRCRATNKTAILCDVNGTLDDPTIGSDLDKFLWVAYSAGIPVRLMSSSPRQKLSFFISDFLGSVLEDRSQWMLEKPFVHRSIDPGMVFDDHPEMIHFYRSRAASVYSPSNPALGQFLRAWKSIDYNDQKTALQPWGALHKRESTLQPGPEKLLP
jgi:hypothetical protein